MRHALATILVAGLLAGSALAQTAPASAPASASGVPMAVFADPAPDAAHPAGLAEVQIISHGASMNAVVLTPSGAGPHPALLLFHGFPGNEQNLDLAQAARRQGWVVLTLHYRGSWGSKGDFSFTHVIEDGQSAYDWLRAPAQVARFRIDPTTIVVGGHSMGGMVAVRTAGANPGIRGTLLLDAWNPGLQAKAMLDGRAPREDVSIRFALNTPPLSGTSAAALAAEYWANTEPFDLTNQATALAGRPVLMLSASRALGPLNRALAASLTSAGAKALTAHEWETDHSFNDHRIKLIGTSLSWLQQFEAKR